MEEKIDSCVTDCYLKVSPFLLCLAIGGFTGNIVRVATNDNNLNFFITFGVFTGIGVVANTVWCCHRFFKNRNQNPAQTVSSAVRSLTPGGYGSVERV